jgi:hypothetical protein
MNIEIQLDSTSGFEKDKKLILNPLFPDHVKLRVIRINENKVIIESASIEIDIEELQKALTKLAI